MGGPLMMLEFEDEEDLWWERLPWLSKVVPMKKMKGGEKEKTRDDREVGSRTESSSSKGKEMWRVAEEMGPDSVRKAEGEEKLDGDGWLVQLKLFQLWGRRKSTFVVTQAHMEWALKGRDKLCGPQDCCEKGQSSRGSGRAFSDGNLSPPCIGPDGMDCRPSMGLSEEQQSEALKGVILAQW
ncbi:hypothetical protein AAG906_034055 [Vitis piasezkii]